MTTRDTLRMVRKNLGRRPLRTALTTLGVGLAVMLLVGTEAFSAGMDLALESGDKARTLVVYRKNRYCPQTSFLPERYVEEITSIAGVESVLPELGQRLTVEGAAYQDVVNGFYTAIRHYRSSVRTVSRFVGGVYVDRAMVGQPGAQMPLRHVELATQQRAMAVLAKDVFAPDALTYLQAATGTLLAQRRGWDHHSGTEDPKLHNLILGEQRRVLDHLLHPRVLLRLSDTGAYGNEYSPADMLTDLEVVPEIRTVC